MSDDEKETNCLTPWDYQSMRVYDADTGPAPTLRAHGEGGHGSPTVAYERAEVDHDALAAHIAGLSPAEVHAWLASPKGAPYRRAVHRVWAAWALAALFGIEAGEAWAAVLADDADLDGIIEAAEVALAEREAGGGGRVDFAVGFQVNPSSAARSVGAADECSPCLTSQPGGNAVPGVAYGLRDP